MKADASAIDSELEERMEIAQKVTSLVHSLRKEKKIRVRQPLERVMIPVLDPLFSERLHKIEHLILAETNVRKIEYVTETGIFVKKVKPDFKALGKKLGKNMKAAADAIAALSTGQVSEFEQNGYIDLTIGAETIRVERSEVEILVDDLPGWEVAVDGAITVALDVTMSAELIEEGLARELINRIQNIRKDSGFEVTDRIDVRIKEHKILAPAVRNNFDYICSETLATSLELVSEISEKNATPIDVDDNVTTIIYISKHN
jgi:isoleucyl-tRNA synthetase